MNNYKPLPDPKLNQIDFYADDFEARGMPGVASWLRRLEEQARRANRLSEALEAYYTRTSRDEIPGSSTEMRKRRELEKAHNAYLGKNI